MCGIAGVVDSFGLAQDMSEGARREFLRDAVTRMNRALTHRGPDDEGVYVAEDRRAALGNRRLSIIDLLDSISSATCRLGFS